MSSLGEWIPKLSSPEVIKFLKDHASDDPFQLSLKFSEVGGLPIAVISSQLQSRQKAAGKLPEWSGHDCIIFPPPHNLEQSSSEITAKFKASLISGDHLTDLTGGTGIDTYYLSKHFSTSVYVEKDPSLCLLAESNFSCLGAQITVVNSDADAYLSSTDKFEKDTWYFLDPSRRDEQKNKVISIHDCEPDASRIVPAVYAKGGYCMIKLSPMLDIEEAIRSVGAPVSQVHVISANGEVKELLLIVQQGGVGEPMINCTDLFTNKIDSSFAFMKSQEESAEPEYGTTGKYLYEASASVRKGGAFNLPAVKYSLKRAARNTHLYFSDELHTGFPGRFFLIDSIIPYQPKKLPQLIPGGKANITTRNFPESVAGIRKKTGLKDGGEVYLFFFTDSLRDLRVAVCRKVSTSTP